MFRPSIIAGCSSGIEPLYAVAFTRNVMEGTELLDINPLFEEIASERGFDSPEVMKQAATLPAQPAFHHWRAAGGGEVDLLLERDGVLHPFEIKLTANPASRLASGLRAFRAAHPGRKVAPGALICAIDEPRWIADDVFALPWNLLG